MTQASIREKLADSLVEQFEAIGKDPAGEYWFEYAVDRQSITGQQSVAPRIVIITRGGDASPDSVGMLGASLSFEMLVEVSHDVRRQPGLPPETETDRLVERAMSDVQRAFLRWVELDPVDVAPVLQSYSWDRGDLEDRLEAGAVVFATIGYTHSAIDPRTQVYDPAELL